VTFKLEKEITGQLVSHPESYQT